MLKWLTVGKKQILFSIFILILSLFGGRLFAGQSNPSKADCDDGMWDISLKDFQEKLIKVGKSQDKFKGRLAELLGFSSNQSQFGGSAFESPDMADHMTHSADFITDMPSGNGPGRFVFTTTLVIPKYAIEFYVFEINSAAVLTKSIVVRGKVDQNSKEIPKSGEPIILDIADPDVRDRFQHEMEVWLKGMHRKKRTASTPQSQKK